ncbi:MAG: DNA repair protein RadC [Endomicrobium sp.]|jgi:DNA repair protein RadC|nr:DNA repair protein RadC [Endomicrobium sp.]
MAIRQDHQGHRQRLLDKFLTSGLSALAEYEILEFALIYALPRKDVKPIAKELLAKFGSLKGVVDADISELIQIKGLKNYSAALLKFLRFFAVKYAGLEIKERETLSSPDEVVNYLKARLSGESKEKFYAILLNSSNKVLNFAEVSAGTINKSAIFPRELAEFALVSKAASVIISHNHPAGSLAPSQNDIIATQSVKDALKTLEIELLDHIIISSSGGYFSFKENGLL